MQLPESDKRPWQWTGGATTTIQHTTSRFSLAIPGAPIVEHAGKVFGDIQWDLYIVTRVPHNVTIRLRHLALPADAAAPLLEDLAGQRANGRLVAAAPLSDPAWGADTVAHGAIAMTLGVMGGAPGAGIRRDDDLLVLGRRDGGVVLVEVAVGERASPSCGAYLHAIHAGIRWSSAAPIVSPPPGCPFLVDGALPQLRVESLREIADLTPRLAAEPAALRDSLLGVWEAMLRAEVRTAWTQPMSAPTLAPAYPQWLRDRLAQQGAYVRTARDLYGLLWIWVRALRAAGAPDDHSYFAAPGPLELRPEREAELDAFAAELAAANLPMRDNAAIASWIRTFAGAADDPASPMIPQLADLMLQGAENHTSNKVVLGKLAEHFKRLRVMRDLQACSIYWCAALARVIPA